MAKIEYSALVNAIKGKHGSSVFAVTKGIPYLRRHNSSPLKTKTSKQSLIRGINSTLSGLWYSLTELHKDFWNSYASASGKHLSGFNSFMKLNTRLFYLFGKSKYRFDPPLTPSTPTFPKTLTCVCFGSGSFDVNWEKPLDSNIFIFCNYRPILPIYKKISPRWKFGFTASSLSAEGRVTSGYENNRPVDFRVRSFDIYGRVSPWSHVFRSITLEPGRYGYSSYGYAYYDS